MLQQLWDAAKDIGGILWPARFSVGVVIFSVPFLWVLGPSQDALLAIVTQQHSPWLKAVFIAVCLFWPIETYYWALFMSRLPKQPARPRSNPARRLIAESAVERLNECFPLWLGFAALLSIGGATILANKGNLFNAGIIAAVLVAAIAVYFFFCARLGRGEPTAAVRTLMRLPYGHRLASDYAQSRPHRRLFVQQPAGAPTLSVGWGPKLLAGAAMLVTIGVYAFSGSASLSTRQMLAAATAVLWLVSGLVYLWSMGRATMGRRTTSWVTANYILFTLIFIGSVYAAPVLMHLFYNQVTAPLVMLSVLSAWVFTGSFFIALPAERLRLPVATLIIALGLFFSLWFRDNHDVRGLEAGALPSVPLELKEAFAQWQTAAAKDWSASGHQGPVPLIIVATAGGASRAGYWTAKILGELEDAHPGFHHYVFAVSGVSGGMLGAGVWRGMLDQAAAACGPNSLVACARRFFCKDFLGPTFLDGMYADLLQRLLPGRLLPDRATALEQSWEIAWHRVMDGGNDRVANRMSGPFHTPQSAPSEWRPLLLINGTSEKTGRRIITSELKIDRAEFADAIDFFDATGQELRFSTALHNAARFTYVDAAGNIDTRGPRRRSATDRILDGGYFENFGADTAFDLLKSLIAIQPGASQFRPVVIQISSDPGLLTAEARDRQWHEQLTATLNAESDTLAPLLTLYGTRDAHGIRATQVIKQLDRLAPGGDGRFPPLYVSFRLTNPAIPMSWAMSSFAIKFIDDEWSTTADNRKAAERLAALLWPGAPIAPAPPTPDPPCKDGAP